MSNTSLKSVELDETEPHQVPPISALIEAPDMIAPDDLPAQATTIQKSCFPLVVRADKSWGDPMQHKSSCNFLRHCGSRCLYCAFCVSGGCATYFRYGLLSQCSFKPEWPNLSRISAGSLSLVSIAVSLAAQSFSYAILDDLPLYKYDA